MKPHSCFYLLLALLELSACQTTAIVATTETATAAAETRSVGEVVDDSGIYAEIQHYFIQTDVRDLLPSVSVTVRQGRVMLTGMVSNPETVQRAIDASWKAKGVKEVINELEVYQGTTFGIRARDEAIEKQLEAKLAFTKGVNILNYSIEVVNSKAYLLGLVANQKELDNVIAVSRRVKGIRQVVSHLRHAKPDEIVDPYIQPDANLPPAEEMPPTVPATEAPLPNSLSY